MFGEILENERLRKGLSKKQVAKMLNVHESTYGKYELDKRRPDQETLKLLADIYGVTTDYLLGKSTEPYILTERNRKMSDKRVIIFDTTLRDGEQTPGCNLNLKEKVELALQLEKLGVDVIEAGFPATSEGDFESVRAIARAVKNSSVAGLCRAVNSDIERCAEALKEAAKPRIHVFIATSPIHLEYKLKISEDECLTRAVNAIKHAKTFVDDVQFSTEDGSRTGREFLYRIIGAAIDAGAAVINVPDTVGYSVPHEYEQLMRDIYANVPNMNKAVLSVHCHNDLGLAVANSLAGLLGGARQVECTVNGLGERAGNAALEEIVMGLTTRKDYYGLEHSINTERIYPISRLLCNLAGVETPPNKAIVGKNAFLHESGIHQHGMMANSATYEIMSPASIGLVRSGLVLGKHSGRHAFEDRLKLLGFSLTPQAVNEAFEKFKKLTDVKKDITDRDLEALISENIAEMPQEQEQYHLNSFVLQSGNNIISTANVSMEKEGKELMEAAISNGPIQAAFSAVDKVVGFSVTLDTYELKAVTEGKDALCDVVLRVIHKDRTYVGKAVSNDIIEASIYAYVQAINRAVAGNK